MLISALSVAFTRSLDGGSSSASLRDMVSVMYAQGPLPHTPACSGALPYHGPNRGTALINLMTGDTPLPSCRMSC